MCICVYVCVCVCACVSACCVVFIESSLLSKHAHLKYLHAFRACVVRRSNYPLYYRPFFLFVFCFVCLIVVVCYCVVVVFFVLFFVYF